MQNDDGEVKSFFVTKIEKGKLTVDGNHPMAGKTLRVNVKILEVRDATEEDHRQLQMQQTLH
jgi:FKBP-type peptidyl-prolyl cis-trans isomerase SlyD